ncbi:MAG: alginate export family protein [Bacteroidales bacterium]|nr:alginate export family protein [Bacteroidales bacterium]
MKRFLFSLLFTGFFIAIAGDMIAQTVKITGEVRPRYEYRHGFWTLFPNDANAASFVSQRTRLNGFFSNQTFKAYISLQDVRVWGDVNQLNRSDANGVSVHEAWAQLKLAKILSLKVGRMEIIYDDHRIFGNVGWAQQARSHDAAVFKFFFGDNQILDAGFAINAMRPSVTRVDYTNKNYKAIQWLYYHGKFGKSGLSILFLNNGLAYDSNSNDTIYDESIAYSQTIGGRYTFKGDKVKFNVASYYQGGKNKANNELSAIYFGGDVSLHLIKGFAFGLGMEYLSGTDTKDRGVSGKKDKSFTPFYGTNHKFNGWMDYFYVGNHVANVGLIDIFLPLKFAVNKWSFALIPHYFMSAATVSADISAPDRAVPVWKDYSSGLGTEIDFVVKYALSKSVNIQGGYSQMFATETMQALKYPDNPGGGFNNNTNNWAWVMLTFKPAFFSKE